MKNKKGELIVENVIFIVLNLVFLLILVLFLLEQGRGVVLLEDAYSKQIALLINSANPGVMMKINMQQGYEIAKENGIAFEDVVSFNNNYVYVRLTEKGGDRYHYFNDVDVRAYPDRDPSSGEYTGIYVLTISSKNE